MFTLLTSDYTKDILQADTDYLTLGGETNKESTNTKKIIEATSYGTSQHQRDLDHKQLLRIEEDLLPTAFDLLSKHHNKENNHRYWKIIVGHWARRFASICINRTKTINQAIDLYDITAAITATGDYYKLATLDSYSAIWAANDERWNFWLMSKIIEIIDMDNIRLIKTKDAEGSDHFQYNRKAQGTKGLIRKIVHQYNTIAARLSTDEDCLIMNTYLPKREEIKLLLKLRQIPKIQKSESITYCFKYEMEQRKTLATELKTNISHLNICEKVYCDLFFACLPTCYLENINVIEREASKLKWPKNPKVIFTSNNYDTDEVFKKWTAEKIKGGTKYIIGQHGNNYGTHRYYTNPALEENFADAFVTWGKWGERKPKHKTGFLLKNEGRKICKPSEDGDVLLVQCPCPHRIDTHDSGKLYRKYQNNQIEFVENLNKTVLKKLIVREHSGSNNQKRFKETNWDRLMKNLSVDNGKRSILKSMRGCRIVVHTYDSTGILEALNFNYPVIGFWEGGFDHIRDEAIKDYNELKKAGIIYFSAKDAARQLNMIWENVGKWWMSEEVQRARRAFCDKYAAEVGGGAERIRKIIKEVSLE
jgi:putative transferase (TIGR04331 family)